MKVLCANEGLMSNFELLEVLRQRTMEPEHALLPVVHDPFPTELQCFEHLMKTPAGAQQKENLQKFLKEVQVCRDSLKQARPRSRTTRVTNRN